MRDNIGRIMADSPPENVNFDSKMEALRAIALTTDEHRFSPDEMIGCGACSRSNPPDRTSCLYCGVALEAASVRSDIAKINYQSPETWQDGFSLVYAGKSDLESSVVKKAADLLRLERDKLERMITVGFPIPLIYLKSLTDAALLGSRLSEAGFDCAILGDDLLQPKVPPTRVRAIRFETDSILLEDFNTSNVTTVRYDERVLLVTGSLVKTSTEVTGKVSKRTVKTMEETLATSDEAVVDIYPVSDVYGFRIRSSGFDYSCLGERMQRFATVNMAELISELRARLGSAVFIDSFPTASPLIGPVWPVDEIKQASSVMRGPLGGVRKQNLTVLDNTSQFTKFSRLQRHFI
jgi:hypothetical protein